MERMFRVLAVGVLLSLLAGTVVLAGNPHFVALNAWLTGVTLNVYFKEAGLGAEPQVHIVLTATAACINPGTKHPKADNKTSVSAEGDFPVQNGKAEGTISLTPTFQPDCTPPMTVQFSDVTITDTTSGISKQLAGTF